MIGLDVRVHISKKLRESPDHRHVMPLLRVGQALAAQIRHRVATTGRDHLGRNFPTYAESTRRRGRKTPLYWVPPTMPQPASGQTAKTRKGFDLWQGGQMPPGAVGYLSRGAYLRAAGRPAGYTFAETGETWRGLTSAAASRDKVRVQFRGSSKDRSGRKMARYKRIRFASKDAKIARSILTPSVREIATVTRWLGEQLPKGLVTDPALARRLAEDFRRSGALSRRLYRDLLTGVRLPQSA